MNFACEDYTQGEGDIDWHGFKKLHVASQFAPMSFHVGVDHFKITPTCFTMIIECLYASILLDRLSWGIPY